MRVIAVALACNLNQGSGQEMKISRRLKQLNLHDKHYQLQNTGDIASGLHVLGDFKLSQSRTRSSDVLRRLAMILQAFSGLATGRHRTEHSCFHAMKSPGLGLARRIPNLEACAKGGAPPARPWEKPVLVLGAGGQTGFACVEACLGKRIPCIVSTRNGVLEGDLQSKCQAVNAADADMLAVEAVDVTQPQTLADHIKPGKLSAVIFAASASTKGRAEDVDYLGLVNTAKACIAAGVPRLVVVSSGTVTRPDSAVYKLLNFVGKGIMEAKIKGEDELRALYAAPGLVQSGVGFTIVRPGALLNDAPKGISGIELNQGDDKSGRIARSDVADICLQSVGSVDAFDTTFECYYTSTAKPVESVGFSNILSKIFGESSTEATEHVSGRERRASTWPALFEGLQRDVG